MTSPVTSEHSIPGDLDLMVPGWPQDRPAYESLAAAVQGECSRWNVPGVTVGIMHRGEIQTVTPASPTLSRASQ